MPRIRTVKPEFFHDEDLAELEHAHRITFVGLWCYADREGRLEDRPQYLRSQIWPYENIDIEEHLRALEVKQILRYEVECRRYILVRNFKKHQKVHHTERPSVIPPPPDDLLTVKQPLRHRECPAGREGKGKEGKGENQKSEDRGPSVRSSRVKLDEPESEAEVEELKATVVKVAEKFPEFNTSQFINLTYRDGGRGLCPPEVYTRVFSDLLYAAGKDHIIRNPIAFCMARFKVHAGNVSEERWQKVQEQNKKADEQFDLMGLSHIIKGIGGGL